MLKRDYMPKELPDHVTSRVAKTFGAAPLTVEQR